MLPSPVPVHHLGMYRETTTLAPVEYYNNLPHHIHTSDGSSALAIVVDPVIATGGTCAAAVSTLREWGAKRILVCWEHDALSDIAERLGVPGLVYPSERFDLVWQIADGRLVRMFSEECPVLDDD